MKFFLPFLCLLTLFACVKQPEPSPELEQAQIQPQYEELANLYQEFQGFRDQELFLRHGFSASSPYADWLQRVRQLSEQPDQAQGARLLSGLAVAWRQYGAVSEVTGKFVHRFETYIRTPPNEQLPDGNLTNPLEAKTAIPIVFTGDTQGVLSLQKWKSLEVGGIARRSTVIEAVRAKHPGVILLDAGDIFAVGSEGADRNNRSLAQAMSSLRYDAVGLGSRDLQIGGARLKELATMARLPLVCSNLEFSPGEPAWIAPYILLERENVTVAVLSLTGSSGKIAIPGVRIVPARDAIQRLMPEIRAKADCVVLLTQLSRVEVDALLESVEGVDVALGDGKEDSDGRARYFPAVPKGMGVSALRLEKTFGRSASPVSWGSVMLKSVGSDWQLSKILEESEFMEKKLAF